jgi:hypothetical protein
MNRSNKYSKNDFDYSVNSEKEKTRYSNSSPSYSLSLGNSSITKYIMIILKFSFYTVLLVFVSFIFLLVLQSLGFKVYSFLPEDGGIIAVPGPTNRQNIMKSLIWPASKEAKLENLVPYNYTISIDVAISNTIINQSVPRVLLYRAPESVVLSATTDKSISAISTKMSQTNFIIYLDPYKNDLMVDVFLNATRGTSNSKVSMSPIENVPIQKPFRITMMLSNNLLEIYINGELQKSLPFNNGDIPRDVDTKSNFYGPPDIVKQNVVVSNVSYWATPLSSKAIRVYGKEPFNTGIFATALGLASTS